jgi:uncharacterized membrane protein
MVKLTWRLSLLFGLTLLFCGYCILLGALAGGVLEPYPCYLRDEHMCHQSDG